MGSGKFSVDHDRFVSKNRMLAAAEEGQRRDKDTEKRGLDPAAGNQRQSCFNCNLKKKCVEFKASRTGFTTGAASFGGGEKTICDRYVPAPTQNRSMSQKQIRSLMKNFKR